jgi:hypothetical protein
MIYFILWIACGIAVHLYHKYATQIYGVKETVKTPEMPWWVLAVDMALGPIGIILTIKMMITAWKQNE